MVPGADEYSEMPRVLLYNHLLLIGYYVDCLDASSDGR